MTFTSSILFSPFHKATNTAAANLITLALNVPAVPTNRAGADIITTSVLEALDRVNKALFFALFIFQLSLLALIVHEVPLRQPASFAPNLLLLPLPYSLPQDTTPVLKAPIP